MVRLCKLHNLFCFTHKTIINIAKLPQNKNLTFTTNYFSETVKKVKLPEHNVVVGYAMIIELINGSTLILQEDMSECGRVKIGKRHKSLLQFPL